MGHPLCCPLIRLVLMATNAGIRNAVLFCHIRRYKAKRVSVDERAGHALFLDSGHVAGNTFAAGTALRMVSVLFNRGRIGPVWRARSVAFKTHLIRRCRLDQFRVVIRAVHVMATETPDTVPVHQTLYVIVS